MSVQDVMDLHHYITQVSPHMAANRTSGPNNKPNPPSDVPLVKVDIKPDRRTASKPSATKHSSLADASPRGPPSIRSLSAGPQRSSIGPHLVKVTSAASQPFLHAGDGSGEYAIIASPRHARTEGFWDIVFPRLIRSDVGVSQIPTALSSRRHHEDSFLPF
ncbi:hypothetical protein BDV97DRAFT_419952 [Delphinella strobiligena]|nr:hypothetical protein BDV97DRAFT_419952 [Delphinella strobiligena]